MYTSRVPMQVSNCLFAFIVCCFPGFRQRMAEAARRPGTYLHNVLGIMGLACGADARLFPWRSDIPPCKFDVSTGGANFTTNKL